MMVDNSTVYTNDEIDLIIKSAASIFGAFIFFIAIALSGTITIPPKESQTRHNPEWNGWKVGVFLGLIASLVGSYNIALKAAAFALDRNMYALARSKIIEIESTSFGLMAAMAFMLAVFPVSCGLGRLGGKLYLKLFDRQTMVQGNELGPEIEFDNVAVGNGQASSRETPNRRAI